MRIFWIALRVVFALFMVFAGIQHFLKPEFYTPFVPAFLPFTVAIIYLSGAIEIILGLLMIIPKYAKVGAIGILLLMLIFLPIHIWDIFSDSPAIGSHKAALIRLPVQLLFIAIAWKLSTFNNSKTKNNLS